MTSSVQDIIKGHSGWLWSVWKKITLTVRQCFEQSTKKSTRHLFFSSFYHICMQTISNSYSCFSVVPLVLEIRLKINLCTSTIFTCPITYYWCLWQWFKNDLISNIVLSNVNLHFSLSLSCCSRSTCKSSNAIPV